MANTNGRIDKFLGVFIPEKGEPIPLAEYEKMKAKGGKPDKGGDEGDGEESKKDKGGKDK